jgi:LPXTG-motif cell wall-anchored protein
MKKFSLIVFLFMVSKRLMAGDSIPAVEPGYETSFTNTELWLVVAVAFLVLVGLYFLYRKRNKKV